jgi:hypothetical protein
MTPQPLSCGIHSDGGTTPTQIEIPSQCGRTGPLAFVLQQRFKAVCECFGFIFPVVNWHSPNVHIQHKKTLTEVSIKWYLSYSKFKFHGAKRVA